MRFDPEERLTEDAVARICEETADSSYRKGSMNTNISGKTVMERLYSLRFLKEKKLEEKRMPV